MLIEIPFYLQYTLLHNLALFSKIGGGAVGSARFSKPLLIKYIFQVHTDQWFKYLLIKCMVRCLANYASFGSCVC